MLRASHSTKLTTSVGWTLHSVNDARRLLSSTSVCEAQNTKDDGAHTMAALLSASGKNVGSWTSLKGALTSSPASVKQSTRPPPAKGLKSLPVKRSSATSPRNFAVKSLNKRRTRFKDGSPFAVETIQPNMLQLRALEDSTQPDPPTLSYGLDKVLFNPGVYELRDHRSGVYNFDPYLGSLMSNDEFDFDALGEFVTSSQDTKLRELTKKHKKKYFTSTSSSTAILSQFHFLLSNWRPPNFDTLSKSLTPESTQFTQLTRSPAAAFLRYRDGVYALDADKQFDSENVLSLLGKSMEKLMTLPKDEFEKYRLERSHELSEETKNSGESYHYTTLGDFVMRSQLDAKDPRLPGTGVFDLKTRAVVSIRMDVQGYEKGQGYEIRRRFGQWESFEREYYDMIRAAFLKYSLQVRMGRMDGIFVAYHNTLRIFGFQYISLEELDEMLHSTRDRRIGDGEFKASLTIFNDLLDKATQKFPGRTLRIHVETRPTQVPLMYFFAEPVEEEEVDRIQKKNAKRLGKELSELKQKAAEEATRTERVEEEEAEEAEEPIQPDSNKSAVWEEMMSQVDNALDDETLGLSVVRQAVKEALDQRSLLTDKTDLEIEKELDAIVAALTAEISLANQTSGPDNISVTEEQDGEGYEGKEDEEGKFEESVLGEELEQQDVENTLEEEAANDQEPGLAAKTDEEVGKLEAMEQGVQEEPEGPNPPQAETWQSLEKPRELKGEEAAKDPSMKTNDATGRLEAVQQGVQDEQERYETSEAAEHSDSTNSSKNSSLSEIILRATADIEAKSQGLRPLERAFADIINRSKADMAGAEKVSEAESEERSQGDATEKDVSTHNSRPAQREPVLGLYVTVRNKVGNQDVVRPNLLSSEKKFAWEVEYNIGEMPTGQAEKIYAQLKGRRRRLLESDPVERDRRWHMMFGGQLAELSKGGATQRRAMEKEDQKRGKAYGAWSTAPLPEK